MALTDTAVLLPGTGHILLGTEGATEPVLADLTAFALDTTDLPAGLTDMGHTSLDDVVAFGQDGGDSEVKGSWQNASLREVTTAEAIDFVTIKALQVKDNTVLNLYYGGGDATVADKFRIPDNPVAQLRAMLIVFLDGADPVGLWVPKASIRRDDAIEVSTDDFTSLPLRFTFLKATGLAKATWIADGLGV